MKKMQKRGKSDLTDFTETRHRPRARKKIYKITWVRNTTIEEPFARLFEYSCRKYPTKKAVDQVFDDWCCGKGFYASMYLPDQCTVTIEEV